MIVGPIDISIETLDESDISQVEIYINNNLKKGVIQNHSHIDGTILTLDSTQLE